MIEAGVFHAKALAAIHAEAFPPGANWPDTAFATLLAQPGVAGLLDPDGAFVLARQAADEAEILSLATSPAVRREGRAKRLLAAMHERLRADGAANIFLEVAADNIAARELYLGLGYRRAGLRKAYYGSVDAWVMRLNL